MRTKRDDFSGLVIYTRNELHTLMERVCGRNGEKVRSRKHENLQRFSPYPEVRRQNMG